MNPLWETFILHKVSNDQVAYKTLDKYKRLKDEYTYFITYNK